MSGAVGSIPSFTRSWRPWADAPRSVAASAPAGRSSTAFAASSAASRAWSSASPSAAFGMEANARLSPPGGSHRATPTAAGAAAIGLLSQPGGQPPPPPMSDHDRPDITPTAVLEPNTPRLVDHGSGAQHSTRRTRLKRLRFVAILFAVLLLGLISFVFGIFVSVAADLPSLTKFALYKNEKSSMLYDDLGHPIGVLSQQNRVIVTAEQIPRIVKDAVVS